MFEIMTPENSATVRLTNNFTGHSAEVITGNNVKSIAYAVFCFARMQKVSARDVGYSIASKA